MGFFGSIMSKIFGVSPAAAEEAKPAAAGAAAVAEAGFASSAAAGVTPKILLMMEPKKPMGNSCFNAASV